MYDYLIVGTGIYGAVFAREAQKKGLRCLMIDKRDHIGGNLYTEKIEGIHVHRYGAHIFHTNDREVWAYINQFAEFNRYTNSPVANYHGELYNLPFNMNTFTKMWGVCTPQEARDKIDAQKREALSSLAGVTAEDSEETAAEKIRAFEPSNLEEQAISLIGTDIYEKLIKGYTGKQWGRACTDLPAFIIKRLPVRFTFDNNYFNALFQGIPVGGYTKMIKNIIGDIPVVTGVDYLEERKFLKENGRLDKLADYADVSGSVSADNISASSGFADTSGEAAVHPGLGISRKVVFTGPVDQYFDYQLGALQYRSVRFETELLDTPNYQGNAVINYTDAETPYTRIIEHKHFEFGKDEDGNELPKTVISREYSAEWKVGDEPYYPVNDAENGALYQQYKALADKEPDVIFGGRLGEYKYYDMDQVIAKALNDASTRI
ncbi:MAG: NAD(P)-binding protein [Parasporobacterium sp.]|nr:NAD(P)-binding protein [Parasporobacterium sp.]